MVVGLDEAITNQLSVKSILDASFNPGVSGQVLTKDAQGFCRWLDPSGAPVGGVTNPLTTDLSFGGFTVGDGFLVNTEISNKKLVDSLPTDIHGIADIKLVNGITPWIQSYQFDFNPSTTNFPTGNNDIMFQNQLPVNAKAGIVGRRTALPIAIGASTNTLGLGSTAAFRDQILYDPLNMRQRPIGLPGSNAFTVIEIQPHIPIGILEFHCHLEGDFTAPSPALATPNVISMVIHQYDNAGVPKATFTIIRHETYGTNVVVTGSRFLMGFAGYGEDYVVGDKFEVQAAVDAASPHAFNVSLAKNVVTVHPVN